VFGLTALIDVLRVFSHVEEIHHEFGPPPNAPLIRGAIAAVLRNPYAGSYHANILPMMEALNPLGVDLAKQLCNAMGVQPEAIQGYGKGALIGASGELEHGALWHVPGGYAMGCAADTHQRQLCAQPFRRHRGARAWCAAQR